MARPGKAETKKALRQPCSAAIAPMAKGAMKEPRNWEPKFCTKPMLSPSRCGVDSAATNDWWIGFIGPSANPISMRMAISAPNDWASPEPIEQREKTMVSSTRNSLRRPTLSTTSPPRKPETPQAREKPDAIRPI